MALIAAQYVWQRSLVYRRIPSRTAERGEGGWQSRDTHEHSTPALRHAWNHHGHARNTIRLHGGGCWSAGLQSWGSVSHQPPKPKAGPGQTGIMASGKRGLFHSLLSLPHFPDGGLRHNLTGTPFSRLALIYLLSFSACGLFGVQAYRVHMGDVIQ